MGQYLAAALALGAVLTAVFSLLASVCGTLVRSPYLAALALCLVCFGGLGLVSVLGELGWWGGLFDCLFPAGNGLALLQRLVHGAGTERRPPLAGRPSQAG